MKIQLNKRDVIENIGDTFQNMTINGILYRFNWRDPISIETVHETSKIDAIWIQTLDLAFDLFHDLDIALNFLLEHMKIEPEKRIIYALPKRNAKYPQESAILRQHLYKMLTTSGMCYRDHWLQPSATKNTNIHGHIYTIQSVTDPPTYKIGKSKEALRRIDKLAVKLPFAIDVIHLIETDDIDCAESDLHKRYEAQNINGEWFDLSDIQLEEIKSISRMFYHD